jgi:hypothetical protein
VEADHGRLQLRAVELLGLAFGTEEQGGGVQLVQVERLGQLERLLLEVIVDRVLGVANGDVAWRGQSGPPLQQH